MCVCLSAQLKLIVDLQTSQMTKRVMGEDGHEVQGLCTVKQTKALLLRLIMAMCMGITWHM